MEEINYPDLLFKIADSLYCVSSRHVISISTMPKYNPVPGAAEGVSGIIKFRGEVVPVVDMRMIFDIPTLQHEYENFVEMLENRKNDHIRWVDELERSHQIGEKFKLATDPHKCAFGKWYDKFHTDSQSVDFHMRKIADPHNKLHAAAIEMDTCSLEDTIIRQEDCSDAVMNQIKTQYMPEILGLLEEAKNVFHNTYRSMLIILRNEKTQIGLIVDEVLSIQEMEEVNMDQHTFSFNHSPYISTAKQMEDKGELILVLDEEKLLNRYSDIKMDEETPLLVDL